MAPPGERERQTEVAKALARRVVIVALLIGGVLMVGPAIRHPSRLFDDPSDEVRIIERVAPDGSVTKERTTEPVSRSVVEVVLTTGGLVFLRFGIALAGAFLAGAVAYHVRLGDFPFEFGPLKMSPTVVDATALATEKIEETIATLKAGTEEDLARLAKAFAQLRAETAVLAGEQMALKTQFARESENHGEADTASTNPRLDG